MSFLKTDITSKLMKKHKNKTRFNSLSNIIVPQPDGKILIGGNFTNYGGVVGRNRFIRLNADGTVDSAFCANAVDGDRIISIAMITLQSDGKILIGGNFTNYGGVTGRNYFVRLNSDGTVDNAFCSSVVDGGKFSSSPYSCVFQPDGKLIIGGFFTSYAGVTGRNYLIRLNADYSVDTAFCANAVDGSKITNLVSSVILHSDGRIWFSGNFTNYMTSGRNRLACLNSDGTLDVTTNSFITDESKINNTIYNMLIQPNGQVLIFGFLTNYGGVTGRNYLVRANSDGTIDTTFMANVVDGGKFSGGVLAGAIHLDGRILLGGSFANYGAITGRNYLLSLNIDGTVDTAFCANAVDSSKFSSSTQGIAVSSTGKIFLSGNFLNHNGGTSGNQMGKSSFLSLNSDGTDNQTFNLNTLHYNPMNGSCPVVLTQPDGKIILAGNFTNYDGIFGRSRLVRLNADYSVDTAFCANASDENKFNGPLTSGFLQPDGKIVVSGSFNKYGGLVGRQYVIRLNSDGTLDTAFCANGIDGFRIPNVPSKVALHPDNRIFIIGSISAYGGVTGRNHLICLNSDGTLDTAFMANAVDGSKFNTNVIALAIHNNNLGSEYGKILIGGNFTDYAGVTGRNYLVKLNSNGTVDTTFCTNAVDSIKVSNSVQGLYVYPLETGTADQILVSGAFTNYGGVTNRNRFLRLSETGIVDNSFCVNATDGTNKFSTGIPGAFAVQPDGKIILAGNFTGYLAVFGRNRLLRLNSDGTLDTQFCVNAVDGSKFSDLTVATSIVLRPNGRILIGGTITNYPFNPSKTKTVNHLVEFESNGNLA